VVLKLDSPQILHKTDSRAVLLNIREEQELLRSFEEMKASGHCMDPAVVLNGIMVQKMVGGGMELIIGISEDELLGPVLMLGWGGVLVESLGLAVWRVCPIGPQEACGMIGELRGLERVLGGVRGGPPLDVRALVEFMVRISVIAHALKDRVSSMDFNPIMVLPEGQGIALVDCRMVMKSGGTQAWKKD
jgi:hypothetical protein